MGDLLGRWAPGWRGTPKFSLLRLRGLVTSYDEGTGVGRNSRGKCAWDSAMQGQVTSWVGRSTCTR